MPSISPEATRIQQLAVGETCWFPCDGSMHKTTPSQLRHPVCRMRLLLRMYAERHGMKLETAHFDGKLLVKRTE